MKKIVDKLIRIIVLTGIIIANVQCLRQPSSDVVSGGIQKEKIDRGLIALVRADTSVYLGWRLLEEDPQDVGFNVYRKMTGTVLPNEYVKINKEPITGSTNYVDKGSDFDWLSKTSAKIHEAHHYKITRVIDGKEQDVAGGEPYVFFSSGDQNYRSILLNDIGTTVQKIGIGDLDGDGAYDYVVLLQPLQHVDPGTCDGCWHRSRDTYKLEAYSSTGKFMWRYDMGWAIETGVWFAPFMVFDLDGDGKAEVYAKGGEGDPREIDGRVMRGPEYLVKIDGETGKIVKKRDWISRTVDRARTYDWTSRNFMGLAYLNGKTPSLIMQRGNYSIIRTMALDKDLNTEWLFESTGENENCKGCGGHNIRVADIDEDGADELMPGTFALDGDGTVLWSLQLNHNDGSEVADIDPDRPGLEIFSNIETGSERNGVCMVDAATGEFIMQYDKPTVHVHDQATVADFDPSYPGMECYANPDRGDNRPFLFSAKGERISDKICLEGKPLYWDDDDYKELVGNGNVWKFGLDTLQRGIGSGHIADLFGDWREEAIAFLPGEIRIYSSTIPAKNKRTCLMQDHQYRMGVASFSVGYATPPQTGLQENSKRKYGNQLSNAQPEFSSHRGSSLEAPENTKASVALAWEQGADAVEIDIHLSKDKKLMVIHDSNTKRTSGKDYRVEDTASDVLRQLDVGSFKGEQYKNEKIPFLEEIIAMVPPSKTLYIEVKCGLEGLPFLQKVINETATKGKLAIICFDYDLLVAAKKMFPNNSCHYLIGDEEGLKENIKKAALNGVEAIDMKHSLINQDLVDYVHSLSMGIYAWTVDHPLDAKRLMGLRVDGIETNCVPCLKKLMN